MDVEVLVLEIDDFALPAKNYEVPFFRIGLFGCGERDGTEVFQGAGVTNVDLTGRER